MTILVNMFSMVETFMVCIHLLSLTKTTENPADLHS